MLFTYPGEKPTNPSRPQPSNPQNPGQGTR